MKTVDLGRFINDKLEFGSKRRFYKNATFFCFGSRVVVEEDGECSPSMLFSLGGVWDGFNHARAYQCV